MRDLSFATQALHAGYSAIEGGSIFPLIDMGVAFPFPSGETARRICTGEEPGYVYTRTANRTNTVLEKRLAALEGGEACLATSSGLGAIFDTVVQCMDGEPGGEIVAANRLYGNTQNLFRVTLPVLGITVRWVERPQDLEAWEALITPKTKLLIAESPSNPDVFVADVENLARSHATAHKQCAAVAEFLNEHPQVESVNYPGLPSHPQYDVAMRHFDNGVTSLLAFVVKGGMPGA